MGSIPRVIQCRTDLLRACAAGLRAARGGDWEEAELEMDRSDVSMANEYGEGHPWLSCHELGSIARQLADDGDPIRLSFAADELLATNPVYASVQHPRQASRR